MDIRQLQTFLVAARTLNFRVTAEQLNYSQSTVSDHIRTLEDELHVKLFERLGKKVFLNEQGEKLILAAEKIIKDSNELHELFAHEDGIRGSLRIGAAETLCASWLPPLLKTYSTLYPKVQISLKMADCINFPQMIEKDLIDIAFGFRDESQSQTLHQIDLFNSPTYFLTAPDHPLATRKSLTLNDLEDRSLILAETQSGYSLELIKLLTKNHITPSNIMAFNSIEAIKQCTKSGLGITLLPDLVVERELHQNELVILPIKAAPISITARMTYHSEKWLSRQLTTLIELIRVQ